MDYVRLGNTGTKVSRICLGMMTYGDPSWRQWILGDDDAVPIVQKAVESGVTFFDTADMYARGTSEELTGRVLSRFFTRREDYVLATKVFNPMGDGPNDRGLSRTHVLNGIDGSLRRLGTDYVDLYQIHRFDPHTPVEETMEALHDVVKAGKARYIGASSMYAWQFAKAQHAARQHGWTPFVTMQNHYNLVYREEEREMVPLCLDQGVGLIPWSPLARGRLTRPPGDQSTTRSTTDEFADVLYDDGDVAVVEAVHEIAEARGVPMAQVALAWVLSRPGVSAPIVGASKVRHLEDAVAATALTLSDEEIKAVESPYRPHEVRGHS